MCGVQLKDGKRSTDLMFMLGLNENIVQLAMAWYGHVLRREGGHVFSRALDFNVDSQGKKERRNRTLKKQVDEESVMVGLRREDALFRS